MLFSIIIPAFNVESYLARCIDSVIAQTFSDYEVLLIDDGSTDGTSAICDSYALKANNIRVWHTQNEGVSKARNLAINNSSGEWLIFCDSDDTIPPDALTQYTKVISRFDPDIVIGQYNEICTNGSIVSHTNPLPKDQLLDRKFITETLLRYAVLPNNFFGSCCVKTFRRNIFTQQGVIFPPRRRGEDWLVNIEYLRYANTVVAIDNCIYNYHRNNGSAMSKPFPEQAQLWKENFDIKVQLIADFGYDISISDLCDMQVRQILNYCIGFVGDGAKNKKNIIDILKSPLLNEIFKKSNLLRISASLLPALIARKLHMYIMAYWVLRIINYGSKIKRRITG